MGSVVTAVDMTLCSLCTCETWALWHDFLALAWLTDWIFPFRDFFNQLCLGREQFWIATELSKPRFQLASLPAFHAIKKCRELPQQKRATISQCPENELVRGALVHEGEPVIQHPRG